MCQNRWVLSGGVLQGSRGAVPLLSRCLEHSMMTRQDPSSGEGNPSYLGRERHGQQQCLKQKHGAIDSQSVGLPRGTCLQPAVIPPLVPREQLFHELAPM